MRTRGRRDQVRRLSESAPGSDPERGEPRGRRSLGRDDGAGTTLLQQHGFTIAAVAIALVVLAIVLSRVLAIGGESVAASPTPSRASTASALVTSEEGIAAAEPSATAPEPTEEPVEGPGPIKVDITVLEPNYTVQPGDTLGRIAAESGNTIETLQGLNRLDDPENLDIGQQLIVP